MLFYKIGKNKTIMVIQKMNHPIWKRRFNYRCRHIGKPSDRTFNCSIEPVRECRNSARILKGLFFWLSKLRIKIKRIRSCLVLWVVSLLLLATISFFSHKFSCRHSRTSSGDISPKSCSAALCLTRRVVCPDESPTYNCNNK